MFLYHVPVWWLLQGETACCVLNLWWEILMFYATKNKQCPLDNSNFLVALAFLIDVLTYINGLNQCLQGRNLNICQIYWKVHGQMSSIAEAHHAKKYFHFSQLSALIKQQGIDQSDVPTTTFADIHFDSILKQFNYRFREFYEMKKQLQLVSAPHIVETESTPLELQIELLKLKTNDFLKNKFNECTDLLEVWKLVLYIPIFVRWLAISSLSSGAHMYPKQYFPKWNTWKANINHTWQTITWNHACNWCSLLC